MTKRKVEISEVIIHPIAPTKKGLVGYISFVYNSELKINDCGIYTSPTRKGGYRFLFPIKTISSGASISTVYPISKDIGNQIEEQLLKEYLNFLSKFGVKA